MTMDYAQNRRALEIAEKAMISHAAVELILAYGPGPKAIAAAYHQSAANKDDIGTCIYWHDVMVTVEKLMNAFEGVDR
jgi:hypothetical protein